MRNRRRSRKSKARNTVSMAIRSRVKSESAIANQLCTAITLPHECRPVRFPVQGVCRKTALLKLRGESSVSAFGGGAGRAFVMLCPSPIHPVWCTQRLAAGTTFQSLTWTCPGPNVQFASYVGNSSYSVAPGTLNELATGTVACYIPTGSAGAFNLSGWGSVTSMVVTFQYTTVLGELNLYTTGAIALAAGSASIAIPAVLIGGSWALPVSYGILAGTFSTANANNMVLIPQSAAATTDYLLPAFAPLELATLGTINVEARVNACSLLMSNTTPQVQRCGVIDAATLEYRRINVFDTTGLYTNITSRNPELRYNGQGEKGCYAYAYPTEYAQSFSDYTLTGGVPYPLFRLEDAFMPSIIVFTGSDALTSTPGAAGQTFVLLYDEHREFVTSSQVWTLGTATYDLQDYQMAVTAASSVPPFTENPLHWGMLANLVYKGLRASVPYLKPLARAGVKYGAGKLLDWLE